MDLEAPSSIGLIVLNWEVAYDKVYTIEVSNNGITWTPVYSTATGDGDVDGLDVAAIGRFVRMHGTQRATPWGYSLWSWRYTLLGKSTPQLAFGVLSK